MGLAQVRACVTLPLPSPPLPSPSHNQTNPYSRPSTATTAHSDGHKWLPAIVERVDIARMCYDIKYTLSQSQLRAARKNCSGNEILAGKRINKPKNLDLRVFPSHYLDPQKVQVRVSVPVSACMCLCAFPCVCVSSSLSQANSLFPIHSHTHTHTHTHPAGHRGRAGAGRRRRGGGASAEPHSQLQSA